MAIHFSFVGGFVALFLMVIILPDPTLAVCCTGDAYLRCGDCTTATPCCGKGPCNIFCCNCDRGCRSGACFPARKKRSEVEGGADCLVKFNVTDVDHDGLLSFDEAKVYLIQMGYPDDSELEGKYQKADENGDGFISPNEFLYGKPTAN